MKTTALTFAAGLVLLAACQPASKQATVTGTLTGMESDTLLATYFPVSDLQRQQMKTDTVVLQQGHFSLALAADSVPLEVYLRTLPGNGNSQAAMKHIGLVAFAGQTVKVEGSLDDYRVTGSEFHKAYEAVKKQCAPYEDQLNALAQAAMQMQQEGSMTEARMDSLQKLYQTAYESLTEIQKGYIDQHPDEDVSVYLLSGLGSKTALEMLPKLGEKAKNGPMAALYKAMEQAVEALKAREEAKKQVSEGAMAPDFTLKDIDGKDLSLSSLRGKYVVLDFWGSWCGWCIKGIPEMKKYYAKYKNRMEILGIDCRDTEEKWKEAVKKHELPWLHVRNEGTPDVTQLYAIEGYPTKLVIDPEGKIAKVVVGEDPAFYEYLDELFK